jgi:dihydrolipoamide dehydrogenase
MIMEKFDIIIIGGGPGGYVAAIKAAQLEKKVLVVEKAELGGICLNWGCIPTKSLLKNAEVLETIKNARKFGINIPEYTVDWSKVIKRSRDTSKRLSKGVEYLLKKNKITHINARAILKNTNTVEAQMDDGEIKLYSATNIIIATGARAKWFPGMEPDGKNIITSKEAMVLEKKPTSMAIIGAGAIGVEFAHFFNQFGTKVDIIEGMPHILPIEDEDISKELERIFKKRKIKMHLNSMVDSIENGKTSATVILKNGDRIEAEKVLVAVGVRGNIENIGLEESGIKFENGWIKTNGNMQTSNPQVYAIGDVAGPPWLAHVASAEGITAVEHICGEDPVEMTYNNVPGCTYCHPEVASIGLTEKAAVNEGYKIKIGKFPFRALGKSMASGDTDGFVKIILDSKYGEILGCHIIGAEATNLITEIGVARKLESTWLEVLQTIHPHPTLSEAVMEATADAMGESIHI